VVVWRINHTIGLPVQVVYATTEAYILTESRILRLNGPGCALGGNVTPTTILFLHPLVGEDGYRCFSLGDSYPAPPRARSAPIEGNYG
jgi:hypothetical protein